MTNPFGPYDVPSRMPEYFIWRTIIRKCTVPADAKYKYYGRKGIKIDPRWEDSFADFINDVGRRPGYDYSLIRANKDGNFDKENCSWVQRAKRS